MRPVSRLVLLGSTWLLMGAACDGLRVPAPPSESVGATPAPPPAAAPPPPAPAPRRVAKADPAVEAQRLDQVRRGLRRLVVAEETYYAENGVYTEDLKRIGFNPERDTQVRFLWLSRDGWAAHAVHTGVPGGTHHPCRAGPRLDEVRAEPTVGEGGGPDLRHAACAPAGARRTGAGGRGGRRVAHPGAGGLRRGRHHQRARRPGPGHSDAGGPAQPHACPGELVWNQGTYSRRVEPFALQYLGIGA